MQFFKLGSGGVNWWLAPPTAASFSLASGDGNTITLTDDTDVGLLVDTGAPVGGDIIRTAYRTLTTKALDWSMTIRIEKLMQQANFSGMGLMLWDSVAGRSESFHFESNVVVHNKWNGLSGFNSQYYSITMALVDIKWLRVVHTGGNYVTYLSADGKLWSQVGSASDTGFLTNRANRVGLFLFYNRTGFQNAFSIPYFSLTGPAV